MLAVSLVIACGICSHPICPRVEARPLFMQSGNQGNPGVNRFSEASAKQIDRLISELGSRSYAVRQNAVEQLWEFGNEAIPALERAAGHNDSEVSRRAKEVMAVLEMGIDKDTTPEIAKLVLQFYSSEHNMRVEVLTRLVDDNQIHLVFHLLGRIKNDDDQNQLFDEVLDFDDTLIRLARADRWDDFEFILSHPITFRHRTSAAVHYHLVNGNLSRLIQRQKIEIKTQENNGQSVNPADLFRLIGIFRLQGDYQQALSYAKKLKDDDQRTGIINQLQLEQGDWNAIAEKMVRPEDYAGPADGNIAVTPAQRALVNQFIGDRAGYEETVNELLKKVADFKKAQDTSGEQEIRETLIEIGLANLDWPLVESNLNPEEEKQEAFRLYVSNNRTDKAFQVVGLGADVEQRHQWFNRRVRNIESLHSKAKRLDEKGQDNDEVNSRLSQAWENSFQIAGLMGSLGLTDESVLHFETLFAALESEDQKYRRFNVIQELIELERYDVVWQLIESKRLWQSRDESAEPADLN